MADNEDEQDNEEVLLTAKQKKNRKKKEAAKRKKQAQKEKTLKDETADQLPSGTIESVSDLERSPQEKFQQELDWCIEQLELGLLTQKPDKKQVYSYPLERTEHVDFSTDKTDLSEMPKKRQVMFMLFGDYRKKMLEDSLRRKDAKTQIKLSSVKANEQKSIFVKVSQNKTALLQDKDQTQEQKCQLSPMTTLDKTWNFETSDNTFRFNFGYQ